MRAAMRGVPSDLLLLWEQLVAHARDYLRGRDVRLDAARASPAAAGARVLVCHDGLVLGLAKGVAAPRVAGQDVGGLDLKNGLPRELIRPNAVV